jgi:polynucleotide 5'-hydroxyl-kinase GRC3/NOL9
VANSDSSLEVILISPASEATWRSVTDDIVATGRTAMIIGRVDTGKSTFCRHLASAALKRGLKVGIVDADVGQSWIGPPTTVGMKVVEPAAGWFSAAGEPSPVLLPDSFYFVGSVSPERHLLQTTVGVKRMAEAATSSGAELVIIDTTGLADGPIGRALKSSKIDLIRPDHIVCFQRGSELEALIRGVEANRCCRIHRLEPPRGVKKRNQNSRRIYRQEQFSEYFSGFISHEFQFSQLRGQRTIFLNGRRANDRELENLTQIVDDRVLYAEWSFKGLFLVTLDKISRLTASRLCRHLSIDELSANTPEDLQQLLTALIDKHGEPICLSLIEKVDFSRDTLTAKCRKDAVELARAIQFSSFRL